MISVEEITRIEQIVSSQFGVTVDDAMGKSRKGACVKARHLILYILHRKQQVYVNFLSDRYSMHHRSVEKACHNFDYFIHSLKEYRGYYEEACTRIGINP